MFQLSDYMMLVFRVHFLKYEIDYIYNFKMILQF